MENPLKELTKTACFSATGSDPVVLKACMKYAKDQKAYFICEATVNQVNQFGGYTGMRPMDYADLVSGFAEEIGFPKEKVILSGDHLGPFVWQDLAAEEAMARSEELVRQYVAAGFRKIHLDPTMPLKGDSSETFGDELIAERAAHLAEAAEKTYEETKQDTVWTFRPVYVIGSEVPVPGGTEEKEVMRVTAPQALEQTILCFKHAFLNHGLEKVWEDTVAVVAQIGLEFSEDNVYDFNHEAAKPLAECLKKHAPLVFESHSSDYQTPLCLRQMVAAGVGILKVGPELTFAHREALFALAMIEEELKDVWGFAPSHFREVLEETMMEAKPDYWSRYYHGSPQELRLKRKYSYSDRSRYYFSQTAVKKARARLIRNLSGRPIPPYLLSQFLPVQYELIREGRLTPEPEALIEHKIQCVMDRYYQNMLRGAGERPGR
ncbi:MAG: class II D-tagatose-bisphosphate aldolase, non-catalytic subunit [Lachnospiraceae bacterium]|nr:class II D-tagatose-bisphosphate aldolase, non-catalytic subunit [Lachnospiraceae bacterium]